MSADSPTPPPDPSMQFDRAEYAPGTGLKCAVCQTPIAGEFFQANNSPVCPACRSRVAEAGVGGSGPIRFARALGAGMVAGFAGFVVYWAVRRFLNMEIGLISILVGWMVGYSVRWGANHRGGLLYQILALALTYVAICSSYLPYILQESGDGVFIVRFIIAFVISLAAPWLEGFGNIIGWVIIAFGLYQAWIMNRLTTVQITGPFQAKAPTLQT